MDKTNEYKFPASDTNKKQDKYFFSLGWNKILKKIIFIKKKKSSDK